MMEPFCVPNQRLPSLSSVIWRMVRLSKMDSVYLFAAFVFGLYTTSSPPCSASHTLPVLVCCTMAHTDRFFAVAASMDFGMGSGFMALSKTNKPGPQVPTNKLL